MKLLKKVNKGLILTIIVILVLAIYLTNLENIRNAEKINIDTACKDYIELINTYVVMPEEYQKLYNSDEYTEKIKEDFEKAVNANLSEFEEKVKEKMIDNETSISMQKNVVEDVLLNVNYDISQFVTTSFKKKITKITKYDFEDDQVTVTFDSQVEKEVKYLELNEETGEYEEKNSINTFDIEDETIVLQKIDDTWKIVYASLSYEDPYESDSSYYVGTSNFEIEIN